MKETLSDKRKEDTLQGWYREEDVKQSMLRISRRAMTWIEEGEYDNFMEMMKEELGDKLIK